nr:RNA-directed DNA polymerase, eukaryota [Tanacetum cinerariifolium]
IFNGQGADEFNSFIANAGLEEVPLGGSTFTWCHKSATKMSKLDRFLISENLFITYPHITATTLERYLSDHRPILLCETSNDYGPIPFRFFHHWIQLEGFNNFVVNTWKTAPGDESNGCNPSFIDLIPKIPDANKVNDFRPISLVGIIYKIIAKILANRLVRVLGDIVNEVQWCIIKKKQSLIFKVDFEKAYDSVRWDFLDDVLKKIGFGNKWCDWDCFYRASGLRMNMSK